MTEYYVAKYVKFIESKSGVVKAATLYNELLTTRFELYMIKLMALFSKDGNTSYQ